ncbi:MAG: hypothetical protein Ct9H300mP28_33580 [Pseudomonadota bacterium]|nr:MAG: hypothetical protein Ct9H300mP28_33580 [Pseudomonadota bacterium]
MSTSIIDYIFRELAISYLGRNELAHVHPDELQASAVHTQNEDDLNLITTSYLGKDSEYRRKPGIS